MRIMKNIVNIACKMRNKGRVCHCGGLATEGLVRRAVYSSPPHHFCFFCEHVPDLPNYPAVIPQFLSQIYSAQHITAYITYN